VKIEIVVVIGKRAIPLSRVYLNNNGNLNARNDNLANSNDNGRMTQPVRFKMKSHKNLYFEIISFKNLILAYKKARKGKTKKDYTKKFEENLAYNLKVLHEELKSEIYSPNLMEVFVLKDPKTRVISKSDFRDRIVHHALCNIIEPIFDKRFIYDSCANRKGKGTLLALERFEKFRRKVISNFTSKGFCLKADIKHYFEEFDCNLLLKIIKRKIKCKKTINLIKLILNNFEKSKGIPLGNLTSQFFANVYLNELNQFVKNKLRAKYYLRSVDDFVILYNSKKQLEIWKKEIENFLRERLKLELHPDKLKIINLSKGIDFVGFRNFYYFRLLRKRNVRNMERNINLFITGKISYEKFFEIFQGWEAYSNWANSEKTLKNLFKKIDFDKI